MNLPPEDTPVEKENTSPESLSRARRRRAKRQLISTLTPDERASYLDEVARKAAPSFDFFLFSLLAGGIIGAGYILDSPYLLLLAALLAPMMAPVVGVGLGTILGSWRYFGRSMGGLLIGSLLVLFMGILSGFVARIWLPMDLFQIHIHSQLTWPPFIVIGIGAITSTVTLVKARHHAEVPSTALAYGLYLPLGAAGFGLGSGVEHLWPDGLVLFLIHLSWAAVLVAVTLAIMGFRPLTLFGYSFGGVIALFGVLLAFAFGGFGAVATGNIARPTATFTVTPTLTLTLTPVPPTETPVPPTQTPTPTITPSPTLSPTHTMTFTPTPVQAYINSELGAYLRSEPGGGIVGTMFDGSLVELLGETLLDDNYQVWVKVYDLEHSIEGWILESLLITATPDPSLFTPTFTPTLTPEGTATAAPEISTSVPSPTSTP